ncbi:MAG TPA: hypothetical protein PK043_17955, partial [Alicycliphilus sp.]|nr:hypothetical protein [Alicycliphilus sp.]
MVECPQKKRPAPQRASVNPPCTAACRVKSTAARTAAAKFPLSDPHFSISKRQPLMSNVHVITHPLVQHKLTLMRKKDAST